VSGVVTTIGRQRRNTELGLVILSVAVTAGAYILASLGRTASLPADIGPFLGVIFVLLVFAHIATRRLAPNADGILLPIAGLLNGLGYVFIARLNEDLAVLHANRTAVGIAAFVGTKNVERRVRDLEQYSYTFMDIGLSLLLVPLVPVFGREINGARIWASIGPINFQPGEFAKIVLAIFFASYLIEKRELLGMATFGVGPFKLPDPKHLGPIFLAWGFSLLVMFFEKDLGSALLFFTVFVVMLWLATQRATYLAFGSVLFAAGAYFAWTSFAHVQQRVDIWLNPWQDPKGDGFQVIESWFALAFGGVTGTGPGLGNPDRIPVAETDFIFSVIGEELGLLGATLVIVAFVLIVGTGLRIAINAEGSFDKLLAAGLTTLIGIQSFIIIAGVLRLLPLTGVTLPFVSYGGSSLVANYILLALLMRISDDNVTQQVQRPARPSAAAR
jgi:cell division protein FtsW (lipid II flippase)